MRWPRSHEINTSEIEDASVRDLGEKGDIFRHGCPHRIVNDYSGAMEHCARLTKA